MNARQGDGQPDQLARTARDYTELAQERAEHLSERAAGTIERAAEALRDRAEEAPYIPTAAGEMAAERMEQSAGYMRRRGALGAAADLHAQVRSHPMISLAGAAVAGYVIGRLLR
jgi:hypothetical protein